MTNAEILLNLEQQKEAFRSELFKGIAEKLAECELLNVQDCPSEVYAVTATAKVIEEALQDFSLVRGEIY